MVPTNEERERGRQWLEAANATGEFLKAASALATSEAKARHAMAFLRERLQLIAGYDGDAYDATPVSVAARVAQDALKRLDAGEVPG